MLSCVASKGRRSWRRAANSALGSVRGLNVHEYINLELLQQHGIPTPACQVASTADEAEELFLNSFNQPGTPFKDVVLKAQVLCGGRRNGTFENGFQGGIQVCQKPGQAKEYAAQMLGQKLFTEHAPQGMLCHKVLLEERMYMRREMYLSILLDRVSQGPMLLCSPRGGHGTIEQVAANNPEVIFMQPIDLELGVTPELAYRMATNLGLDPDSPTHTQTATLLQNLYRMFVSLDCTLIEINPLAETPDGKILVRDVKINFDDNAAYRQPALFARKDETQEDPREIEAEEHDLEYIGMNGNIGCMVNGAGLAMATMDMLKLKGGQPANFLDVGGGSNETQVQKAFEILNADDNVQAILINIFGGIQRCDVIAAGLIHAAKEIGISKPIVIRLQGTNAEQAQTLIDGCGIKIIMADNLNDAAEKVVGVADIAARAEKIHVGVAFEGLGI